MRTLYPQSFSSTSAVSTSHIWICTSRYYRFHWILFFQIPVLVWAPFWKFNSSLKEAYEARSRNLDRLIIVWTSPSPLSFSLLPSLLLPPPLSDESATTQTLYTAFTADRVSQKTKDNNKNFLQMGSQTVGIDELID